MRGGIGRDNAMTVTHMLPKLNARRILSVLKYLAHRPYRLPNGCILIALRRNDGRRREKRVGKAMDRTREYDKEP